MTTRIWSTENVYTSDQPLSPEARLLAAQLSLSEITAHLLATRSIKTDSTARAYLNPDDYSPTLPDALPDMEHAVAILQEASSILIWGDFDVDGVAATAILFEGLSRFKNDVRVHIARRRGMVKPELEKVLSSTHPSLILTCDTGSSASSSIDYAKSLGIKTIITDHHHLPEKLPPADAHINPQRLDARHPLHGLTGVGVAYLLMQALYAELGLQRHLTPLLDLLPLGLIGDLADLRGDVRYWVQRGLQQLAKSSRIGLQTLARQMKVDLAHVTAEDVGFRLVPPLNAFGRLADPLDAFRLLTTRNSGEASTLAVQADSYNQQRRHMTRQTVAAVRGQIEQDPTLLTWQGLVLENPRWEAGILSAAAAQLAEDYQRPVVLLVSDANGKATGSARSPGGYNLMAALGELHQLLTNYGGHHSAAGLSLPIDNLPMFRRQFSNNLVAQNPSFTVDRLTIDARLSFDQLTLELAQEIERLAPFGAGNPRPVMMSTRIQRKSKAKIGRDNQHHRLTVRDENGIEKTVFWWNSDAEELPEGIFDLAYQVTPIFRDGQYDVQLTLVDWRQVEAADESDTLKPTFIDCRNKLDLDALKANEPSLMIWAEGYSQSQSLGVPLSDLGNADALLIYTAPPHLTLFNKALKAVLPQRVYLHAELPSFDTPQRLLEATAALLRTAQEQFSGRIRLRQIAERTAHTEDTIRLVLTALGDSIEIEWISGSMLRVIRAGQPPKLDAPELARAIEEAAAYRRYLRRVDIENLGQ